jgi:PGF-pre-PGF domain-containing protein
MAVITFGTSTFNVTNATSYNSTQGYQFNVTVTNDTTISTVWIRANFSNAFANYTVTTFNASIYYYTNNTLAAGTYTFTWCANDTALAFYNSTNQTYQVTQNTTVLSLTLNATAGDRSYFNNSIALLGNITNPGFINSSLSFYYNTSASTAWTVITSPQTWNVSSLSANVYWVLMNFTGNQNYTNATSIRMLTLNDSRITFGNFSNNVTNSNSTNYSSTQGYQFNVTAFNSSQYNTVWIRANFSGAFVNYTATMYGVTQFYYNAGVLATGNYTYTWCANNSLLAYFNSSNQTFQVNKSSPVLSLTLNATAGDRSYFNNSIALLGNITNPGFINSSLSFYYNTSASTAWTVITSPQTWNVSSLSANVYWVLMNFTGNQNYTNATSIRMLTLNDSRITFGNFSNNVTNSNSTNYSSTQGYQFNVTAFNSSQYNTVWIRANFSGSFTNYTATVYGGAQFYYNNNSLAAGNYTYTWCANDSLLAFYSSSNQTFQVNQSYLPLTLYINGTNDDSTTYNYSVANLTANFSSSYSFNITLWTNLTGSWTLLDNEPSPITNYTDLTPYQAVNYSVIANWTGNANYTISSASHYLTLVYYTAPPTPPTGNTGGWGAPSGPSQGGQQSVTFVTIEAGVASIAKYTDKLLDVREINITVSNPANTVKITVSKVDEQPATITHSITGTVYKYFNITTQNLDESNIAKARLKFRVNKTWFSENNLNPATTKLNRYESNGWRALSTTQTTSDTDYYYFEAETPGFSTFAVTATKTTQPAPTTCTNTCQPGQSQKAYPDCTCYTPEQPSQSSGGGITPTAPNYDWLIFIMVVVVVTLVLVYMMKKRIKSTAKHRHR